VRIGVTLGDPCGIGPEVLVRALARPPAGVEIVLYGDAGVLERAGGAPPGCALHEVTRLEARDALPGRPTTRSARAQIEYLEAAAAAARAGELDALVTGPISKSAAAQAGFAFPGHTEYLAVALGAPSRVVMMLAGPRLKVTLVTIHLALRDVSARLDRESVRETIFVTAQALRSDFGIVHPRLAVAALNPHAGESGAFGDEEKRIIGPAIEEAAVQCGWALVSGPHVPDAVFRQAAQGAYDAVVCMYHDQGLIPVKLLDFDEAVNVTLGLPIVRTSPDHGVAYDIAGSGRARATSTERALAMAAELAGRRRSR